MNGKKRKHLPPFIQREALPFMEGNIHERSAEQSVRELA